MREQTSTLPTLDDMAIHVFAWLPDGPPRAVVQIAHGMGEHAARYRRFAEALTAQGYAVYADDHRGHGQTARTVSDLGFFADHDGFAKVVQDLRDLTLHIQEQHPGLPIVLMGHSMGSYMAQMYAFKHHDLAGLILSGSSLNVGLLPAVGRRIARVERFRVGARKTSWLLTRLSFGEFARAIKNRRTDFDWLSRDPAEVDAYIADPLCGFDCTTQLWIDLLDSFKALSEPSNVARIPAALPIHIVSGGDDPVHNKGKGFEGLCALYGARGFEDLTHKLYEGARHEILNETNREQITDDLRRWLDRVTGEAGASAP